jgi:hypothetical protein
MSLQYQQDNSGGSGDPGRQPGEAQGGVSGQPQKAVKPTSRIHPRVLPLLNSVRPSDLRDSLADVFSGISHLLDRLGAVEEVLKSEEPPQSAIPLFDLFQEASRSFLVLLERAAARVYGAKDDFSDVLDYTYFAIRHELRRVYESELLVVDAGQSPGHLHAEMLRAHGLLTTCLQQSYVTIAQVLDRQVSAADLFRDVKLRYEQSVILYEQLGLLSELAKRAEKDKDPHARPALRKALRIFSTEYLHLLMYRDWAEFERFSDSIFASRNEAEQKPLLHQFGNYLGMLMEHVRMRAVLGAGAAAPRLAPPPSP